MNKDLSKTSRNFIPELLSKADVEGKSVLNYGAGRFWKRSEDFLHEQGATVILSYDLFVEGITCLPLIRFDVVLLANVLNVIESDEIRLKVIHECISRSKTGKVMIDIYAKDGTGIGAVTRDGWQANMTVKQWGNWFEKNDIKMERDIDSKHLIIKLLIT